MKEFKGTQGKWTLSISKRGRKANISGKAWQNHTKVYIQTQDIEGNYTDSQEGMANAQLIETAPELLESLQEMVELLNFTDGKTSLDFCIKYQKVINKALGL